MSDLARKPSPRPQGLALVSSLAAARQAEQDALGDDASPWDRANAQAAVWLRSPDFMPGTREQYAAVYDSWRQWCVLTGISPFEAKRSDVMAYTLALETVGNPIARNPRPLARRTIARHMATLSSYYAQAVDEEMIARSPVPLHKRPKASTVQSRQPHLTRDENRALLAAADADGVRSAALVALLLLACLRISEALSVQIDELTHENGHDVVWVTRKGDKGQRVILAPEASARVRAAIGKRRQGPILVTSAGKQMDRKAAWDTIRRLGRTAGISAAIGPHTLRHAFITRGHELGLPLADLQDAAGHSDPVTTRLYDRSRDTRHPAFAIARDLAGPEVDDDE
jgi:site-specific recombinase XerD